MRNELVPLATILTPNLTELSRLAPGLDEQSAVSSLDCPWILVTTADYSEVDIEHRLYHQSRLVGQFPYKKLPGKYHGSGCTLSCALSALIASDVPVKIACKRALDYTCLLNTSDAADALPCVNRGCRRFISNHHKQDTR